MLLFTEAQLRELELQTLIFNHLASGIPVPPHLFAHFKRSLYFLDPYSLSPSMSYGRRAEEDQEPWRCKRTDGKKWRCSKEAFQDSKYCERHMHRGKKSSRKLVEILPKTTAPPPPPVANTSLFLGSPSCYNFFKDEEKQQQQQKKHCYVLGADLMLKNPVMVEREQEPKPLLCLFSNDQEEAYYSKTQLSISIP